MIDKMITIEDFQKGDIVYILTRNKGRNADSFIKEAEVTCVGRIYVTTGINYSTRKYMNWDADYLYEKVEFGEATLLFKTKEDAQNYLERAELAQWLGCISIIDAEQYSLEQLRKVKEILNHER